MLRGFALFGVLLVNMYNFGATDPIYTGLADRVSFSVMRAFLETKSWRLFSFLFGLGFSLQWLRAEARGQPRVLRYLRRLVVLFLIGAAHALFYDGDILMLYAEFGLVLMVFWRVPPRLLLGIAVALLAIFPVGRAIQAYSVSQAPPVAEVEPTPAQREAKREARRRTHPYAVGSLVDVMRFNAQAVPPNPITESPFGPESQVAFLAMFLLGLYAGRRRIFGDLEANLPLVRSVFRWGFTLGLLGMAIERGLAFGWDYRIFGEARGSVPLELIGGIAFGYGSTALSMGYAGAIVLATRHPRMRRLVEPLGPVGRMALTVYLTQSLAFTTLFYGYGFGGVGRLGPFAVTVAALLIFAVQVAGCVWWVRRYRFGPVEWLWRGLTYLRLPKMRLSE